MNYAALLVGLADPDTAPRVMAAACALARAHQAHLRVVHVSPATLMRDSGMQVADWSKRLHAVYKSHRDDRAFSSEWCVLHDDEVSIEATLVELGNACDALVLGQRRAREAGRSSRHLGERIVGTTARPVLLVPEGAPAADSFDRVLLAWDGSAAATRAAFDALPLLQHAKVVRVHRFNPPTGERLHVSGVTEAFAETLARHGVSLELARSDVSRFEIGVQILSLAKEFAADVVVMGSRRHAPVRKFVLGDTTRRVFDDACLPVLMGG